jgi:hypothetical protein
MAFETMHGLNGNIPFQLKPFQIRQSDNENARKKSCGQKEQAPQPGIRRQGRRHLEGTKEKGRKGPDDDARNDGQKEPFRKFVKERNFFDKEKQSPIWTFHLRPSPLRYFVGKAFSAFSLGK